MKALMTGIVLAAVAMAMFGCTTAPPVQQQKTTPWDTFVQNMEKNNAAMKAQLDTITAKLDDLNKTLEDDATSVTMEELDELLKKTEKLNEFGRATKEPEK
ncbi:hypothetical protein GF358_00070 [Candidatus Woesearchaeota archaeon]|nr:hypothetical protein [Candidatus Woesearchaeota archaeon]